MRSPTRSGFQAKTSGLDATQRDLLGLLALHGEATLTALTNSANDAGLRATPTRQLSTQAVRLQLEILIAAGLVCRGEASFSVLLGARPLVLREAAQRGRLRELARVVRSQRLLRYFGSRTDLFSESLLELEVSLADGGADLEIALIEALSCEKALGGVPGILVARRAVFPAVVDAFDPDWFARLGAPAQARLLELAVLSAESAATGIGELYPYALMLHPELIWVNPATHSGLFGVATLAGDLATAEILANAAHGTTRSTLMAALALATGQFGAEPGFVPPKKDEMIGVARVLQALLLLGRGRAEDLDAAGRIAHAGKRKTQPFRGAAAWLETLVAISRGQLSHFPWNAVSSDVDVDCLEGLLRATAAIWLSDPGALALTPIPPERYVAHFEVAGQRWLAAQYRACLIHKPPRAGEQPSTAVAEMAVRPLFEVRAIKEPWELSLEALERVAGAAAPSSAAPAADGQERLLWRVTPSNLHIEPYLQVGKSGVFTRGRKLAIKHLLPGAKQLEKLPPEDRAVAKHAYEYRESTGYGYPQVFQVIDARAWLELIGHPRVELHSTEQPVEVTRGTVQIVAETRGESLVVRLEPKNVGPKLSVHQEPGKLVVYQLDPRAVPLLDLLGSGLTLPASAKERALASLGRLSHLVPVQTSERTAAKAIPADARLWLRVVPRGGGFSVTAFVRPLGPSGLELSPGVGATHLLGHHGAEAVQTERDLSVERAALAALLTACPAVDGLGAAGESAVLEDAQSCLELLSVLQRPDCEVVAEWPEGAPFKLRGRVSRSALRARVEHGAKHLFAEGTLTVDDQLSLQLQELIALVAESPGKFARLANGDFIELERELRETLELLGAASVEQGKQRRGKPGVALSRSAYATIEQLSQEGSGFTLGGDVASYQAQLEAAFSRTPKLPRGLEATLRDYQLEGFRWLARLADAELSACLADDMGLGKTLQAIALLLYRAKQGPALVVAPTSVCENWQRELTRFAPSLEVRLFAGAGRERELDGLRARHIVVTSYALLQQNAEQLQRVHFATAILDEAQLIKNAESQRAQAACALDAAVRFALTGTPVENHIGDLYSIFRFLAPDLVGTWPAFNRRFGAPRAGETGNQARRSLKRLLRPYLLRRTKAQVLDELPPLTEIEHRVELSGAEVALYEGIRRQALAALEGGVKNPQARLRVLAEITRLRRLCCHPHLVAPGAPAESAKLDALLELIIELRAGHHRALVFSQFVDVLTLVKARLEAQGIAYQYLDGSTPPPRRTAAVDAFQAGDGDVFLISLKAGGFGLNLTAADYVIHVDPWWNPAVESQASDRAHRIGQTRPVTVYRLIASGTIEERIVELHKKKRELADSLLDESHTTAALSPEDLRTLLSA